MYSSSAFNPPLIPAAVKTLSPPSSESRLCTISTARSRRRMNIKVSLSSVVESITFKSSGRSTSLYEVLRIDQKASQMEIKTAYRSLAKLYHPDAAAAVVHDDDSESDDREFIQIHDAYETLSDPASRAMYDLSLDAASNYYRRRRSVGFSGGYYTTQRWETDQCW